MANSLSHGHTSPRSDWSASCSSHCSLGTRWRESRTGCPAFLSKFIVIGAIVLPNLIVSEKPSVAQAIGKALGITKRRDGYLEGGEYLVSWCVGHLVELAPPGNYDPKLVKWSKADLPILPKAWQYLVSTST